MAAPVITPELQWSDANGTPYAGGTITTYVAGTSTPKSTWLDPGLTALNTNPVVLNAAGRSLMFGDGDYRLVLKDVLGNLVFDISATTIVSAAMAPIVSAPSIADALNLLGVTGLIAAEATARSNADAAELNARVAADNSEASLRSAGDSALADEINTERTDRINADNTLQAQISAIPPPTANVVTMQTGSGSSNPAAAVAVTFPAGFATRTMDFQLNGGVAHPDAYFSAAGGFIGAGAPGTVTLGGATGYMVRTDLGAGTIAPVASASFTWFATGR